MLWLWLACAKPVDAPTPQIITVLSEPAAGWYDGACYAARDGELDRALGLLSEAIRRGTAPLGWMTRDPDLVEVRALPRYAEVRDAALDDWIAANPATDAGGWMAIARARSAQERDPSEAIAAAEALGHVHAVFAAPLDADTPGLADVRSRRESFVAARRGTITVEMPDAFELANVVLSLTTYGANPNATERESAYFQAVEEHFGPHRDAPIVQTLDAIPVDMDVYYALRNGAAGWELGDDGLIPGRVYPPGAFGDDLFGRHREALDAFVEATDFRGFLASQGDHREARRLEYLEKIPIQTMWDWLEARFPAEGDGRNALVVRSSLLIGGSHNASTLRLPGFTEGTMVVPIFASGEAIAPEDVGPLSRMVFTEIDHHYVNPVSDRMRAEIESALPDIRPFNAQRGYPTAYETFNEYATWLLFDVWWSEWCDQQACSEAERAAGPTNTARVMERRKFTRYAEFREALVPVLRGADDLEAQFPAMIDWFAARRDAAPTPPIGLH